MVDNDLLKEIVAYNIYRKQCFKNGVIPIFEDKEFEKRLDARYHKVSRIRKRLVYLYSRCKYLYFVTFTLDDNHINLCDRSRKDLIKKSLLTFDDDVKYIINVDYGKTTERLHYHAVVGTNLNIDLSSHLKIFYPCFSYCERIRCTSSDFIRTSKYLNKLSNHACKDSTRKSRVLYNFKGYDSLPSPYGTALYHFACARLGLT